jgi:probable phosphoglycerate mutase
MTGMLTLLLVRHASHGLLGRTLAGRMPGVSLSEAGRAEAERVAALLAGRGVTRVIASPLERTRETAAAIAARAGLSVEVADEIVEIDCGAWTGADLAKLPEDPRWHRWNRERATCRVPGGETMAEVQARALGLVARLAAGPGEARVALVTHSDVVKAVAMAALGLSLDRHDHLTVDPASVTTLHVFGDYMRVVRLNEAAA